MPQLTQSAVAICILKLQAILEVPQYRSRERAVISSAVQIVRARFLSGDNQLRLQNMRVDARQIGQVLLVYVRQEALAFSGGSATVSRPPTPGGLLSAMS
jgi:hypothetical protein